MPPTYANGKICYIEIPALDAVASAAFYHEAFGWEIRHHDDGSLAFDDGVFEVSGTWRTDRTPSTNPGIMIHIMVADAEATVAKIIAAGGEIVAAVSADPPEITAHFRDVAGNVLSIYQERALRQS
jgi:predicted enzyme related to lactoylglutathione lyase